MSSGIEGIYTLTPPQASLLFHSVAARGPDPGCVLLSFETHGDLNVNRLRKAFEAVVARHAALRTSFQWEGLDEPLQIVHENVSVSFDVVDSSKDRRNGSSLKRIQDLKQGTRFDLNRAPLVRLTAIPVGPRLHRVLLWVHHLVVDGWSAAILLQNLFFEYERIGKLHGDSSPPEGTLMPVGAQFPDYLEWLGAAPKEAAAKFWTQQLDGFVPAPLFGRVPAGAKMRRHRFRIHGDLANQLAAARGRFRVTDNTLLLAAWSLCVADVTGRRDVAIGGAVSGRPDDLPFSEQIVGSLTTTIPVRIQLEDSLRIEEWLRRIQSEFQSASLYSFLAPEKIARCSMAAPGEQLFDSVATVENYPIPEIGREGLELANVESGVSTVHPLTIMWRPRDGELLLFAEPDRDPGQVEVVFGELERRLAALANCSQERLVSTLLGASSPRFEMAAADGPQVSSGALGPIDEIERVVHSAFQYALGIPLSVDDDFFDLGGNSLGAVRIVQRIESLAGRRIAAINISRYPTVRSLAGFLRGKDDEGFELLVTLFDGDDRPPLFAIPPGGDAVSFVEIAKRFSRRTMIGVQAQGLNGRELPLTTIEEMASRYVDEIIRFQPEGPYHFVTICGGGTVLLEVVASLQLMGKVVESFIVIDPTWIFPENRFPDFKPSQTRVQTLRKLTEVVLAGKVFSSLADRVKLTFDRRRGRRQHMDEINALDDTRRRVVDTYHDAAIEYGPKKVSGVLTAVVSKQWREKVDFESRIRRWEFLMEGGVDHHFIEASHYSMSLGEHAATLASLIEDLVEQGDDRSRGEHVPD